MTNTRPSHRPINAQGIPPIGPKGKLVALIGTEGPDATLTVTVWENRVDGLPIRDGMELVNASGDPRSEAEAFLEGDGYSLSGPWDEYSPGHYVAPVQ